MSIAQVETSVEVISTEAVPSVPVSPSKQSLLVRGGEDQPPKPAATEAGHTDPASNENGSTSNGGHHNGATTAASSAGKEEGEGTTSTVDKGTSPCGEKAEGEEGTNGAEHEGNGAGHEGNGAKHESNEAKHDGSGAVEGEAGHCGHKCDKTTDQSVEHRPADHHDEEKEKHESKQATTTAAGCENQASDSATSTQPEPAASTQPEPAAASSETRNENQADKKSGDCQEQRADCGLTAGSSETAATEEPTKEPTTSGTTEEKESASESASKPSCATL